MLQEYGANRAERDLKDEKLTTVIANSPRWEGWEEVGEDSSIDAVTDKWVERSVVLGKLQLAQHFSTNPALLFSGVVACSTSDLPPMVPVTYRPLLWDSGCAVAKLAEKFSKVNLTKNVSLLQL